MVTCRASALADLDADDWRRWADLADRSLEPTLFLDPTYFRVSARHLLDPTELRLLIVEDDDRMLGLMAFDVRRIWARLPLRAVTTGHPFMVAHAGRRQPLLDRDRAADAIQALLDGLQKNGLPGVLELDFMPADGPQAELVGAILDSRGNSGVERWRDERAYSWADGRHPRIELTAETLFVPHHASAATRKGLRRDARNLAADLGYPLSFTDRGEDPEALEQFLTLQASGWKGDASKGGAAYLLNPALAAWIREVTDEFRRENRLHVFELRAGDTILFMSVLLRSGRTLVSLTDAYDERFAGRHPGSLGRVAEVNTVAGMEGIDALDPGFASGYVASARLYPDRRPHAGMLFGDNRLSSRTVLAGYRTARRLADARRARRARRAESVVSEGDE